MTAYDAVVIGAGPNGLVAANLLCDAGWSVVVLEAQPEPGGGVRSSREVHPDFVHDTFSAFYPFGAASPVITSLQLEQHGLEWSHAPAVLGHPRPDGSWALLHRDRSATAALMDAEHPGDGDAWLDLCGMWDEIGDQLVGGLLAPFPPIRAGAGVLARLRRAGGLELVRTLLSPARELGKGRFGGDAPGLLLAGNAGHADIPLDAPGSGLLGLLLTMLGQQVGFPVPVGGAGELSAAMVTRLLAGGGELRCRNQVVGIDVEGGRPRRVRVDGGEVVEVRHAVVADVAAPYLYETLLDASVVPSRVARGLRRFQWDPGTVKVDWALNGPVPWASPPAHPPGTVHVADSLDQMTETGHQIADGVLPAAPFMLCGQMTTSDPTRSPTGTESLWAYTHVPHRLRRDGADGTGHAAVRGVWDRDDCERFADRVQDRIEALAPGFGGTVLARRVLGPRELERTNANLVGGALGGGTAQLHQQLVFRPVPGWGRAETGVAGVYLGSASAHPGGGVHGAPGANAARAALAHARPRRLLGRIPRVVPRHPRG